MMVPCMTTVVRFVMMLKVMTMSMMMEHLQQAELHHLPRAPGDGDDEDIDDDDDDDVDDDGDSDEHDDDVWKT